MSFSGNSKLSADAWLKHWPYYISPVRRHDLRIRANALRARNAAKANTAAKRLVREEAKIMPKDLTPVESAEELVLTLARLSGLVIVSGLPNINQPLLSETTEAMNLAKELLTKLRSQDSVQHEHFVIK